MKRQRWSARPVTRAAFRVVGPFIIYFTLFINYHSSVAQLNSWQSHVSYRSGQSVAVVGNKIYAATQNGFFYYDKITGETTPLTKQSTHSQPGLSDVGISRLLYLADQQRLLIAYRNGNLDFLTVSDTGEPGAVKNVSTIVTAPNLPASRGINHVLRLGNDTFLSTDFGLVVLDVVKDEVRDTYFSRRPDGSPRPVYQTAATPDSLYALTAPQQTTQTGRRLQALRLAPGINLVDPGNWRAVAEPGLPTESIVARNGRLVATVNEQGVFERQAGQWTLTQALTNGLVRAFAGPNEVVLATERAVTQTGGTLFTGPLLADPREVVTDGNRVWVADAQNGLLAGNAGTFERIAPEGPRRDNFAGLYTYAQTLVALPNGPFDASLNGPNRPAAERLSVPDQRWRELVGPNRGFNAAAYLPTEQRLYGSVFGDGLWSYALDQPLTRVPLPTQVGLFISSLATDLAGNLWMTTAGPDARSATLHVRRADGAFQSFPTVRQPNIAQVVADDGGLLWLRLDGGGGLLVFDPATNRLRPLTTQSGQGGLLTNTIGALAKDRTGAIWVGTDLGPTVFDNPAGAFDAAIDAQPPLLNGRRLLANEVVTSLAVDGGNQKWIGTRTGLYHVAPDGSQLLGSFTADNSPLPSNPIQALAVEPVSGRVFVQTSHGLVSYRGPATEPAETLSRLTIFPNPVRPDFNGTVGINGLTDAATVKVLDAGGQLVYETRSQGGTATWNLRDYRNRPAQTGVYLIVVVAADGTEGLAGKLAVVR